MIKYVLTFVFIIFLIQSCAHQEITLDEKYLVKKFKIRSKSMYVDMYSSDSLIYSSKEKNFWESCLYDTNGNIAEDYYGGFDGRIYRNNYYYDIRGRKVKELTGNLKGDTIAAGSYYEYNDDNDLILETRRGRIDMLMSVTRYIYNNKHQLINKIDSGNIITNYLYEYDSRGNLIMTTEDNSIEPIHHNKRVIIYDDADRISVLTHLNEDESTGMVENYKYDERGNIIEERTNWEKEYVSERIILKDYDSLDRVIKFVEYEGGKIISNSQFVYNESGLLAEKRHLNPDNTIASVYRYVYEYY